MRTWLSAIAAAAALTLSANVALAQDNGSRTAVGPEASPPGKPVFNPRGTSILSEDFADITTLAGAGWVLTNESMPIGTTNWFQGNTAVFNAQAGAADSYIGANFNNTAGTGTISNWLISPVLPLNTITEISFWSRSPTGSTFPDRIQVWMNPNNTGSSTADFTVMLADINPTSTVDWTQTVINSLPGAPAMGRFAFRYFVTNGGPSGANSDFIGIDSLEVIQGAPALSLGAITEMDVCAAIPGNVNSIIEPGETVNFAIPVMANNGAFTNVTGTLTSGTAGINIVTGMGMYGNIADGGSASANFSIRLDETVACNSMFDLTFSLTSTEGNFSFPLTRTVGSSAMFVYNSLPLAIPDNMPAGATSTATVAGVPSAITAVSVNLNTTHTWVGDLIFTLTSPMGTTVTLLDQPGVPASTFGCSDNDVVANFADGQPDPESICDAAGGLWPVTMAGPTSPLSAFNGEDANGVWTLTVSDNAAGDTGMVNDWELIITPAASGTCNVCPSNADVSVTKTSDAGATLLLGDTFNYMLTASNAGPGDATGVVVTDTLPGQVTYVSNTCSATFSAGTVTWNIGNLANGASANCSINVQVTTVGAISNTATITSTTNDPNPANNAGTVALAGAMLADLSIAISSDAPNNIGVGQQYTYTVVGTNAGPSDATGVLFSMVLPSKVSFVSSTCGATVAGNIVSWSVPILAVGASSSCDITVAVVAPGDIIVTADVTSATPDPNLVNNSTQIVVGFLAVQVPTLGTLGLLLIGLLLAGVGVVVIRRV